MAGAIRQLRSTHGRRDSRRSRRGGRPLSQRGALPRIVHDIVRARHVERKTAQRRHRGREDRFDAAPTRRPPRPPVLLARAAPVARAPLVPLRLVVLTQVRALRSVNGSSVGPVADQKCSESRRRGTRADGAGREHGHLDDRGILRLWLRFCARLGAGGLALHSELRLLRLRRLR